MRKNLKMSKGVNPLSQSMAGNYDSDSSDENDLERSMIFESSMGDGGDDGNSDENNNNEEEIKTISHPKIGMKISCSDGKCIPKYETELASGFDLKSSTKTVLVIKPGCRRLIKTGIKVAIPSGFELQVRSRSGLAYKHGIVVLNSPGTRLRLPWRNWSGSLQ